MRFCYVMEKSVPEETGRLLSESCAARGIDFVAVEGRRFDYDPARRLESGDLLYRGAVSTAAARAEQFLYREGVSTFFTREGDIYFGMATLPLLYERAGLSIPSTVYASSDDRTLLGSLVERVGGFPVIVKILGRSSGIGVMLLESMPSLVSIVGYALAQGQHPLLCAFIRDAIHWRLVVVGDEVVGHYRNAYRAGDFRTDGSRDPADFAAAVPPSVHAAAVRATHAGELEFSGVDVLEDPAGTAYVLEANFPCYYPHAQLVAGADISGAMVDHLVRKSLRLSGRVAPAPAALHSFTEVPPPGTPDLIQT
jgi:hypothetical protein